MKLKLVYIFLAILLTLGVIAGCSAKQVSDKQESTSIPFETLKKGKYGYAFIGKKSPDFRVFRSASTWRSFWNKSAKRSMFAGAGDVPYVDPDPWSEDMSPLLPEVNFNKETVVGAFFDAPAQGYDVAITKVNLYADKIIVDVELTINDKGGFENIAPYQIVSIEDHSGLPIKFDLTENRVKPQ